MLNRIQSIHHKKSPINYRAIIHYEPPFQEKMARVTRLELATSGVTGRRSNQLSYTRLMR